MIRRQQYIQLFNWLLSLLYILRIHRKRTHLIQALSSFDLYSMHVGTRRCRVDCCCCSLGRQWGNCSASLLLWLPLCCGYNSARCPVLRPTKTTNRLPWCYAAPFCLLPQQQEQLHKYRHKSIAM